MPCPGFNLKILYGAIQPGPALAWVLAALLVIGVQLPEASAQDAAAKPAFGVASPMDAPGAQRKPAGLGMQDVTIIDAKGFNQPMPVATVRIPSEWVTRGGIEWDRQTQCVSNMMRFGWTASEPDGSQGFEIRPGYTWQVQGTESRMNPCSPLPVNSVRDFMNMIVNQRYGNRARILEFRNRPDLAQAMQTGNASGLGRAWHEAMRKSMQPNQQWFAMWGNVTRDAGNRIAQEQSRGITRWHNDQMAMINLKGANDRSQIRMQTQGEVSQIYSQTWQSTQATNDRMHRRNLAAIGEYNTYQDPSSNVPVRGTIHNNHVWKFGDGRYVSTNDPNFKPGNGVELKRIRRSGRHF